MPTIEQIRAARALIGWSQKDLADNADLSQTGVARIENGTNHPNSSTIAKILGAFDRADVEFIGNTGVKKRPEGNVKIFSGQSGFIEFMELVYEKLSAKHQEDRCVYVNNVQEDKFVRWIGDYAQTHVKRMEKINAHFQIIIQDGDTNFIANCYAKYKWLDKENFSSICYYVFSNFTALINFEEYNVFVYVIESSAISAFYRNEFSKVWGITKEPILEK